MLLEHKLVVHSVDMVAREYKNVVGVISLDEVDILINRVRGSLVPVGMLAALIRGKNRKTASHSVKVPRCAVGNVFVEGEGLILSKHAHGINSRVNTVGEREIDNFVFSSEGYGGLCDLFGKVV